MSLGSQSAFFFGAAGAGGGGEDTVGYKSVRFQSADSAYLNRTPSSAGNRKTWTFSTWVKRAGSGARMDILSTNVASAGNYLSLQLSGTEGLVLGYYLGDVFATTPVYRDFSAWMHVVLTLDTTLATAADRVKLYVNGSRITTFSIDNISSVLTLDSEQGINAVQSHSIGRNDNGANAHYDGYLADVHFVDGQALTPSSFAETDATTKRWVPKAYVGAYGVNGFHLDFNDSSTSSALGTDTSGKGNNWTVNNIVTSDGATYSPDFEPTGGTWYSGNVAAYAFNGLESPYSVSLDTSTLTFAPTTSIPINTSLRLWYPPHGGFESTKTATIDGTSSVLDPVPNSYYFHDCTELVGKTISTSTPLTITATGSRTQVSLTGIEVDGVLLVDGVNGDSFFDSPAIGTQSDTGVGGEVTGNYATLNPLNVAVAHTFANGNLEVTTSTSAQSPITASVSMPSGKFYCEVYVDNLGAGTLIGIYPLTTSVTTNTTVGGVTNSYAYYTDGQTYASGSFSAYGASYTAGDTIGIAFDGDSGTLRFYKNGADQGQAFSGIDTSLKYAFAVSKDTTGTATNKTIWNFGQRAFAYTAPSGYKALCTTNLTDPTIADGSAYMDATLYTGTGSSQSITGINHSPDFVWIKSRSNAESHCLFDIVRGADQFLLSNSTAVESDYGGGLGVTAFNSDGFTLGTGSATNGSGQSLVAWTWDGGSSTVSNTDGSITSSVRANASAGFSIVSWTGNRSNSTVGHGLNVALKFLVVKNRDQATNWMVWHEAISGSEYLRLNSTGGKATASTVWNSTIPTSSVFSLGADTESNGNTDEMIAYCWAPVTGFSAFGSYTGNGSTTDGTFIHTGFRPRFFLTKASSTTSDWYIWDTERDSYNASIRRLFPNLTDAESVDAANDIDIVSNGIKMRTSTANATGVTYIYAAFAEYPFKYANAR